MKDVYVCDLKSLREKYIGARLDIEKVNKDYDARINPNVGTFELSFTFTDYYDMEEFTYEMHAEINSNGVISKIAAPHCQRLRGDDALRSTYRAKRMDDMDYERLDKKLQGLIMEE